MQTSTLFSATLFEKSLTYEQYMHFTTDLVAEGKTSGPNQSAPYVHYTKLNLQRMKRLNKTVEIPVSLINLLTLKAKNWTWITLTEPWCGDAAQCVPVIQKLAAASKEIQSIYLLRDEHPQVMDAYLTNGGRSIPKLICLDENQQEVFTWGPRPAVIQEVMNQLKADGVTEIAEIVEAIQKAYNADDQAGIYAAFELLLKNI
ncbi:MAG: thioredoxin family protein [Sphingomonadales bacterium]|nr:thioredoxin family protein [Sphingomonadales bacterium]